MAPPSESSQKTNTTNHTLAQPHEADVHSTKLGEEIVIVDTVDPVSAPEPHPEGGYGWVVVIASFWVHFFIVGGTSAFGVYLQHFTAGQIFPNASNLSIAFIGSISACGLPLYAIPAGRLADKYGYRPVAIIGGALTGLGYIASSFATEAWHIWVSQAVLFGVGSSFAYMPAISIISQWFEKKRGMAVGIAVAGSGVGGLALSPLIRLLIRLLEWRWALCINGIVCLVATVVAALFYKTRVASKRAAAIDFGMFRIWDFTCLYIVAFFNTFGYFIPFFFLSSYAVYYGISTDNAALLLGVLNGASAVGRLLWGYSADRFGHMNTLTVTISVASLSVLLIWPFSTALWSLMVFAIIFGSFIGGFISLFPTVIAELFKTKNIASINGMLYSSFTIGNLFGSPLAGLIIDRCTTHNSDGSTTINFIPAILFGGACMLVSSGFVLSLAFRKRQAEKAERTAKLAQEAL
ncbi:major facilitator superfamily domain-containing protein [Polychytrium aggregatum]|uniref:major facilitator superfamily domain-containing protein n=1 Tax=Polychytrium aggregatum TaxID=110093 RepID=UPI0022FE3520|nr:major facilitator superfamily domain-containing protein [Polychytrium aggregatum]KAI9207840.1 major facilitator superfamily domain-containing protein [Polychytrium aggregatum]